MTPSYFATYIDVQGKVDVEEVVNAIPETPGIISAILVKPGQMVRKGQIVATLRSDQVDRGMAELDQQLAFAKTLYEKQQRLWAQEIGTEVQLLSAKNQYESLVKKKASVQSQRNTFNVISPIDGQVDAVSAAVGQSFASPMNPPVIRIINTSKLKVIANIAENYSGIVHTGSPVMLIFPDIRDSFSTKITYAERFINQTNRSIFLTGKAGTGKTTLLKRIITTTHKKSVIVAPTGIAALNAGGVTIHSFFQLPFSLPSKK
jgi:multidrug efflux pump subunit AcrA (membrane-fusion protein)